MKKRPIFTSLFACALVALLSFTSCDKNDDIAAVVPTATFSYTAARNFPVTVRFTNTSTDVGTSGFTYNWNFGDGAQSSVTNPTHSYSAPGFYNVSLNEVGPSGSGTVIEVLEISTGNASGTSSRPASTDFVYSIDQSFTVTFTDQSQNATSTRWTFGDGTEVTNPGTSFTHVFSGAGPFVVQLTATGSGGTDQASATISF